MAYRSLLIETINCDTCGMEEEKVSKNDNQVGRPDFIETDIKERLGEVGWIFGTQEPDGPDKAFCSEVCYKRFLGDE